MFLANSLKERLKKNFLENDTESFGKQSPHYQPPPRSLKVLLNFKGREYGLPPYPNEEFTSQQLQALDKREWEHRFSPSKLKQEWETRVPLDFASHHKKFPDSIVPSNTRESKAYVKNLIDNDTLELKQKQWNISTDTQTKLRPELKKTLFEVNHGLNAFQVVPLKEKAPQEGCDSRNKREINGNTWEISNKVEQSEKQINHIESKLKAEDNTSRYWKDNEHNRQNENEYPISEERKKIEIIRYFKKYKTPYQKHYDFYRTMNKVRALINDEYLTVRDDVLYKNPGSEKYPEKINALIFKQMYNTYRNKYNELTNNIDKEQLKRIQAKERQFHWNDSDLINKIISVSSINDTSWFNPKYINNNNNNKDKRSCSQSQSVIRKEMLKSLVIKGNAIHLKEEEMKEQMEEEYKKQQKKEWLLKQKSHKGKTLIKNKSDLMLSKYPIDKSVYDKLTILHHSYTQKDMNMNDNDNESNTANSNSNSLSNRQSNSSKVVFKNAIFNNTTERSFKEKKKKEQQDDNKLFLNAYKTITEKEVNRENALFKKELNDVEYTFVHPGKYRMFEFKENVYLGKEHETDVHERKSTKVVRGKLWSCCMNEDYNSQGCQKVMSKKFQWYYDQPM